VEIQHTDMII